MQDESPTSGGETPLICRLPFRFAPGIEVAHSLIPPFADSPIRPFAPRCGILALGSSAPQPCQGETRMTAPRIETYRFGHIVIDGHPQSRDVIILPDRVIGGWWRREGHVLHPDDLKAVFQAAPQTLVVGQGAQGRMRVTQETRQALQAAGIELIAQATEKACQTYNAMRDKQDVAAALHLAC